ncbi:MAG: hypothetical protein OHK0023_01860 [Anaerolineae bacterium]
MPDKRSVDDLSIEELERILAIKKREARLARLTAMERGGRRIPIPPPKTEFLPAQAPDKPSEPTESASDVPPPTPEVDPRAAYEPEFYEEVAFEDDLRARRKKQPKAAVDPHKQRILWWNRALAAVEVAAVIGLIVLVIGLLESFNQVSQTSANLQAEFEATRRAQFVPPTETPVIGLTAVVLPTGHTFEGEQAVFNLEEVPAQYRDQFVNFAATPRPRATSSPQGPVRVRIPRINVDAPVVIGDDWESLKLGVGHHLGSANPGERGNMVLSAHNDVFGEIFRHLDQLRPGDEIVVSTFTREYTYVVQPNEANGDIKGYQVVLPTDVWVLNQGGDAQRLTLISCYPYRVNTKRIVVFATLK